MKRVGWLLTGSLALSAAGGSSAWAQRRDATQVENGQDIDLAVGESRTISAKDVKNYSEGVAGVVDIKLTSDNSQFVINGRRAGSTTLLLIKSDGSQITVNLNVFLRSPAAVEKELTQLLGNIQGVSVRRLGSRFVIDGAVASDADLKRVQHVATLYREQVDSLVQLGTTAAPVSGPKEPDKRYLIRIDFYFVQYDKNSSYGVGLSWPGSYGGDSIRAQLTYDFLTGTSRSATASLINQPLPRLDLASRRGWAKVLKQATVIANNDTEATFQNGAEQNFPINTGLTIGITKIISGTELTVLPHYEPLKRELSMKLTADVSDLTASVSGTSLPGRTTSKLTTSVSLKLGQSLVLSGIRTRALTHSVEGLPLLSDIPILGILFGSHSQSELQTEGAIFVVPSIIESVPTSSSELVEIALQKFKGYSGNIDGMDAYDKRPGGEAWEFRTDAAPSPNGKWEMDVHVVIAVEGTDHQQQMLRVSDGVLTIGRSPACTITLESSLVSRQHARVDLNGPMMRVEDSSTNGTLAGSHLINNSVLDVPKGLPIRVGEYTIMLREHGAEYHPTPPPIAPQNPIPAQVRRTNRAPETAEMAEPAEPAPAPAPIAPEATPVGDVRAVAREAATPSPIPPDGQRPEPSPSKRSRDAVKARAADDERVAKRRESVALRREIHRMLLEHLDLGTVEPSKLDDPSLRPKVLNALRRIVKAIDARIPVEIHRDALVGEMVDEALGLGPLENFLADPSISEIMVVDPESIYVEQKGKLTLSDARFTDDSRVRAVIERIVTPLGRRIDESSPIVDARLADGSRVNAVIRPLALRGSAITIRKFSRTPLTLDNLISFGALTEPMGRFLTRSVVAKRNVVISGGTGSGKTTLLNVLSGAIPADERVVTIEDAAELQLKQPHVVSLETRPANMEGKGEYTIRDLVKNSLRMRPDRIVVGECRGGEALDMLQAMNTGHDGSLTTTHANSPREALARLETLVLMAGIDLPIRAIREQIAGSVHLLVQQSRLSDGSRKVTAITEVIGIDDNGEIEIVPIFKFLRTGTTSTGKVEGEFRATGFLPSFLNDFIVMGLVKPGENYL